MQVRALMHPHPWSVRRDDSLAGVVELMAAQHITAVPVTDAHRAILGVVSVADLLSAQADTLEGGARWETEAAADWMTSPAITVDAEAPVGDAVQLMHYTDTHRVFVTEQGALAGVLSQTDILHAVASRRLPS